MNQPNGTGKLLDVNPGASAMSETGRIFRYGERTLPAGSFGNSRLLAAKFKHKDKWRITGVEGLPGY